MLMKGKSRSFLRLRGSQLSIRILLTLLRRRLMTKRSWTRMEAEPDLRRLELEAVATPTLMATMEKQLQDDVGKLEAGYRGSTDE